MKTMLTILGAVVLAVGLVSAQSPSAADLYQEALRLQEVKGDLGAATEIYKRITTQYAADAAVAPLALLRLAECYEILSEAEALTTYRRLLSAYPNAGAPVTRARARLAALAPATQLAAPTPRLVATVPGGAGISTLADVSADGQFALISGSPSDTLTLRSLATGQVIRLVEGSSAGRPFGGRLSPDGQSVAYDWRETLPTGGFRSSIRVAPAREGATGREILPVEPGRRLSVVSWFPDGSSVLVESVPGDGTRQLLKVPIDQSPVTVVASRVAGLRPQLSPDGRWIAIETHPEGSVGQNPIVVVDANDGTERAVVNLAGRNTLLGWTDEGSHLLFSSDRNGGDGLWAVRWSGSGTSGAPFPVRGDVSRGMAKAGSFYYTENRTAGGPQVFVVDQMGAGSRISQTFNGRAATWSPDGRQIAFLTRRFNGQNLFNLVIRSVETGEERAYSQTPALGQESPRWLPSGDAVVAYAAPGANGRGAFYRVDLATGTAQLLFNAETSDHVRSAAFALSPDGTRTYHAVRQGPDSPATPWTGIVAVRLADGVEEPIATFPGDGFAGSVALAASPDGSMVAVYSVGPQNVARLVKAYTDGSGTHQVSETFTSRPPGTMAWTRDGLDILIPVVAANGSSEIRRVAGPGLAVSSIGPNLPRPDGLPERNATGPIDMSPDNSRLLVVGITPSVELWALDNLTSWLQAQP